MPTTPSSEISTDDRAALVEGGLTTIAGAADFLNISRAKVYQLMDRGELRYCKLGRNRRIPWAALKALASASLVGQ
jgi:excisionase family DNA binding protein